MRTSTTITETERNAYELFCQKHHILNDQSADGLRNGEHIGAYIGHTWNEDITERTLGVALEKLRDRLVFIPAEQVEVAEILSKLDQGQRDVVASWLSHQHRLEVDGPKGFSNVSVLVAWLLNRKYAISEANLTTALGNAQNSGHRKIFWKELPKQRREVVQGRPNHAFGQEESKPKSAAPGIQQQEFVNGRRNHAYTPPGTVAKRTAVEAPEAWQEIINLHMKEWVTSGQRAKLENELNSGVAAGRTRREIAESLGRIVRDQRRGR
jgi:hypothetical protein